MNSCVIPVKICDSSVWADDSWLKEHAGATLNTEANEEETVETEESNTTTKETTSTVGL